MLRHPHPSSSDRRNAPLLVRHLRLPERSGDSHYTPGARIALAPALPSSGLLQTLPGEEVKTLLALLAFVSPNGKVQASAAQVADVLGIPERKARDRLLRLETLSWRGEPVIRTVHVAPGLDAYVPGPHLLADEHEPEPHPNQPMVPRPNAPRMPFLPPIASLEEALQDIEQKDNSDRTNTAESTPHIPVAPVQMPPRVEALRDAIVAMCGFGVSEAEAAGLVSAYPLEVITRQMNWMPERNAKVPARFLVAAIRNDYASPNGVRAPSHETEGETGENDAPTAENGAG